MAKQKNHPNVFLNELLSLDSYEFTLLANVIGYLIAPQLTLNQQNALGNFTILIGQMLLTINAQNQNNEPSRVSKKQFEDYLDKLRKKMSTIDDVTRFFR